MSYFCKITVQCPLVTIKIPCHAVPVCVDYYSIQLTLLHSRPHAHAPGGGERARGHHRAAGGQVPRLHLREDQGRQHSHAHRLAERTRGLRHDAVQEGGLFAHAK